ncbi:MAG: CRISPR system precrRNA processing endoribonuclease RAMP protein Cas6 [Pseudomonadales bacterium]|nr:CRISPR system precrRNA processing endoribonuclease RAMP protein Cas6 [Pseudomonadales bacterium]
MMISLARYRFTFAMNEPVRLTEYAGSTLRGAFGHAFRHLSCMTRTKECTCCPLLNQCPFPQVFAPHELPKPEGLFARSIQQIPVPYVVEAIYTGKQILRQGESLAFNMVLAGNALEHLPLITLAWQRALAKGVTSTRSTAELKKLELLDEAGQAKLLYGEGVENLLEHQAFVKIPAYNTPQDLHLNFLTPLRIEIKKKALGPKEISATTFWKQLIRRISLFTQFHCAGDGGFAIDPDRAKTLHQMSDLVKDEKHLRWKEWVRYSGRQDQAMHLGGVTGHWLMRDVPPVLLRYAYLGQWLHAGKEAAFGLGHYQWLEEEWVKNA